MAGSEVGGLFIHPKWQRRGIGTALMNKAKSLHDTLELEVFEANEQGRSFYAKYGFELIGKDKDEVTGGMMLRLQYKG